MRATDQPFIDRTREVWQPRATRALSDEDARQIAERVTGFFSALLWPAERTFPADSGLRHVQFVYPESELGWLPLSGPTGVITRGLRSISTRKRPGS